MSEKEKIIYEIQYTKAANKFFKTHEDVRKKYEESVRELMIGEHPEKVDVRKIKGKRSDYYRIRLGNYRIIYAIIRGKIVVVSTLMSGARGDIYNKMSGMQ